MKKYFASLFLISQLSILSEPSIFAQTKNETKESEYNESPSDPYVPNLNPKFSPPYKFKNTTNLRKRGSTIFTTQVNISAGGLNILNDAANEPNITINPVNPNQMAIGWRQFDNIISNFRQAGYAYSTDAGHTWTFPGIIEPGVFHSDPVLDYDNAGNFFYNSLRSDTAGNYPCLVYKSADGGVTWNNGTAIGGGDKQWMTIDRTNGVGSGNIYSAWTEAYSFCPPGFFTRSSDGGDTFDSCVVIDGEPDWGTETVGINGEVFIVGRDFMYNLIVSKSSNAQNNNTITWDFDIPVFIDGSINYGSPINPGGLNGQANIDVDRSSGSGYGNIYVVAPAGRMSIQDWGDIMFTKSTDGGLLWEPPIKINDDSLIINTQWFGTLSVAPNGRIDVAWLDTRDNPGSDSSALYYSYSVDQGATWSVNEKMSDSFDPHVGYPNQQKMGDYFDMISDNSGAHLAWANTLNGEEDVYYSYIIPAINTSQQEILNDLKFSIYPNPSTGQFILKGNFNNATVEIYNVLGKIIFSERINKTKSEIDISECANGIYFLRVRDGEGNVGVRKVFLR